MQLLGRCYGTFVSGVTLYRQFQVLVPHNLAFDLPACVTLTGLSNNQSQYAQCARYSGQVVPGAFLDHNPRLL